MNCVNNSKFHDSMMPNHQLVTTMLVMHIIMEPFGFVF